VSKLSSAGRVALLVITLGAVRRDGRVSFTHGRVITMSLLILIATFVATAVMSHRGHGSAEVVAVLAGGAAVAAFMLASGNGIADEVRRTREADHQGEIVALLRSIDERLARIESGDKAQVEADAVPDDAARSARP
jgi:hypothetical protein